MNPAIKKLQPIYEKNKRQLVINALTSLAQDIGVGGKLPTMLELSRQLNVAIGTLDDCLRAMESRGIIYRKHGSGIYVTPRVSQKRIGLVFGRNLFFPGTSSFYSILLDRCMAKARERNAGFSFYLDVPDIAPTEGATPLHQDLVEALEEKKLDGLLATARSSIEQEEWLLQQGIPVVTLGGRTVNSYWVSSGDTDGFIEMGVETLVKQGCKSIGLFGAFHRDSQSLRRVLKKYRLPVRRGYIKCPANDLHLDYSLREGVGREGVSQIFGQAGPAAKATGAFPDGLVIVDDLIARGVCAQLESLGWVIGKDIKIATQANKGSLALTEWDSKMTLLEIDPQEIVDALFGLLESLMAGIEPPARGILCKPVLKLPPT